MAMDPPSGVKTWDPDVPDGGLPWNQGDDDIRNAMSCLEEGLDHEHDNMSDIDNRGGHREGSGRAWVDSQPNYTGDAFGTGRIYFDPTDNYLEVCEDGATDDWQEIGQFNKDVEFTAGLNVSGGAGSDITLAAGSKIIIPAGEASLDDGASVFIPHDHGARHREMLFAGGVWTMAPDRIGVMTTVPAGWLALGAPVAVFAEDIAAFGALPGPDTTDSVLATKTLDLDGRGSARFLVLASVGIDPYVVTSSTDLWVLADSGSVYFGGAAAKIRYTGANGNEEIHTMVGSLIYGVSANALQIDLIARAINANNLDLATASWWMIIDLGDTNA